MLFPVELVVYCDPKKFGGGDNLEGVRADCDCRWCEISGGCVDMLDALRGRLQVSL